MKFDEALLNSLIGIILIPIFVFAHLGIMNQIESSIKKRDAFFEFWSERLDKKSYEEISKELFGTYSFRTIKLLSEPDLYYKSLKRRMLTSVTFERLLATILALVCFRATGSLTFAP